MNNSEKFPMFKQKTQRAQQNIKPLVYDRRTDERQIDFKAEFFPVKPFYIKLSKASEKALRIARMSIMEILKQNIRPEKERTKEPEKQQEFDFNEDLVNEFIGRF